MLNTPAHQHVGYSVLRSEVDSALRVCLVLPHVETPCELHFDPVTRRLDLIGEHSAYSAPEIPEDVALLLAAHPDRVIVMTTDALSSVRSATTGGSITVRYTH